jgi:hypothetical protein
VIQARRCGRLLRTLRVMMGGCNQQLAFSCIDTMSRSTIRSMSRHKVINDTKRFVASRMMRWQYETEQANENGRTLAETARHLFAYTPLPVACATDQGFVSFLFLITAGRHSRRPQAAVSWALWGLRMAAKARSWKPFVPPTVKSDLLVRGVDRDCRDNFGPRRAQYRGGQRCISLARF